MAAAGEGRRFRELLLPNDGDDAARVAVAFRYTPSPAGFPDEFLGHLRKECIPNFAGPPTVPGRHKLTNL